MADDNPRDEEIEGEEMIKSSKFLMEIYGNKVK
jgi:hypothetical protein